MKQTTEKNINYDQLEANELDQLQHSRFLSSSCSVVNCDA